MLLVLAPLLEGLLHVLFGTMCGLDDLVLWVGFRIDLGIVYVQDVRGGEETGLIQVAHILRVAIKALF